MTWLQYAALTWRPAFSIGNGDNATEEDAHGCANESLNVYPEVSASVMLESARLSHSLEGDENFCASFLFIRFDFDATTGASVMFISCAHCGFETGFRLSAITYHQR